MRDAVATSIALMLLLGGCGAGASRAESAVVDAGSGREAKPALAAAEGPAAALRSVRDADPMRLGRLVDRHGDDAIIALLSQDTETLVRLQAIRASARLSAPERALPALVQLLGLRDSVLAPAAGQALREIAPGLQLEALRGREADLSALTAALAVLQRLQQREGLRADLRTVATELVARLKDLGVRHADAGI
ncbi:MAG: hypothetical protein OEZ06_21450 [Myxococcales bacterium]|nr:hypothetical protein [Myxococcales bacterium]